MIKGFTIYYICTHMCSLWSLGENKYSALGFHDNINKLLPTRTEILGVDDSKIVSICVGERHAGAVTENGKIYSWDKESCVDVFKTTTFKDPTYIPRLLHPHILNDARVGRFHNLPPLLALAFAMGTHSRLGGSSCKHFQMPEDLLKRIVEACAARKDWYGYRYEHVHMCVHVYTYQRE